MKLLVIAKSPVSGRSKTRLCPPCTPSQAADLAEAALVDTLDAVLATPDTKPVLVLDGEPGPWLPDGIAVIAQRGDGLDERIAAAFEDAGAPAFLVGMDTPQLTPSHLSDAVSRLSQPGVDVVLGAAEDGGWWGIGLRASDPRIFIGVPMSTARTVDAQRLRLVELGLDVVELPVLRDVDVFDDAVVVAALAPATSFARAVATLHDPAPVPPGRGARWVAVTAIVGVGGLIAATHEVGRWLQEGGRRMAVNAPPLTGNVDLRVSPRALAAVAVGALGIWRADELTARLPWRRLLLVAFATSLLWAAALAFWDGGSGFTRSAASPVDYLRALPFIGDAPGAFLRGFVSGIDPLPSHVRAHPPGLVLALWGMDRVGLSGAAWAGALELLVGAATIPAVLVTTKDLAGDTVARVATPFLMLAPMAVFWGSGDAVFMGVGAWAVALLVLATGREGRGADALALAGGAIAAIGLFLSYGLVLLGFVPIAIAVYRGRFRPLVVASIPIALVMAGSAAAGFWWIDGLNATRREYAESIARVRPYIYFVIANLAALAVALGPAVWVAVVRLRDRALWVLVGAGLGAIVIANLSGLSKAEVERIWLPFMPWLIAATGAAFVSSRSRRGWLLAQVGWALALQMVVLSPW